MVAAALGHRHHFSSHCSHLSILVQYLAILQEGSHVVPIWKASSRKMTYVDTNFQDLTFLKWSKTGYELAVGTAKGNLLIYKASAKKKIPVMGKHVKVHGVNPV